MNLMPRRALLLLALISTSGVVAAGGPSDARKLLENMTSAMSEMTYQGTFVYVRGAVVETMRITHIADATGIRERLYSLSGPQREVVRDQNGVRCIFKDSSSVVEDQVVVSNYFPELPLSVIDSSASGYSLETGGQTRIAGYKARRVSIKPKDKFRYGYDFWLQEKTGLLLKWALLDANHEPLATLVFTELTVGSSINVAEIESDSRAEDFIKMKTFSLENTVERQSKPRWQPEKLPPGFELTSHNRKSGSDGVYEHMVYSDGLAAVSVYVEQQAPGAVIKSGVSQLGTNNAYIRKRGELQITVIGEVPALTVRTIADEMARAVASN